MSIRNALDRKGILLADGAWGTEFAKRGFTAGTECPELLNVDSPDLVLEIASSYVQAGSDIILTNTFGGNSYTLAKYNVDDRLEELNEAGVRISKQAAGDRALVLGSIGPSGTFLAPLGTATEEEMTEAFARQVRAFVQGGADGVIVETMTDLGEVRCAVSAVRNNCDLPLVCSMTFDKGPKGYATMMGIKPDDAVRALSDMGVDIAGSNCGSGIENIIEIARIMRPASDIPLWFKPNAGMPELVLGHTVYRETPEHMASRVPELIEAGASVVGGCCGTTPDHIRTFRQVIDKMR